MIRPVILSDFCIIGPDKSTEKTRFIIYWHKGGQISGFNSQSQAEQFATKKIQKLINS